MSFDRKGSEFDRKGRVKLNEFDRKGRQKGGGGACHVGAVDAVALCEALELRGVGVAVLQGAGRGGEGKRRGGGVRARDREGAAASRDRLLTSSADAGVAVQQGAGWACGGGGGRRVSPQAQPHKPLACEVAFSLRLLLESKTSARL